MYKVVRQKRKSIGIRVTEDLEVVVKAPYYVTEDEIEEIVHKHSDWIDKTKKEKIRRMSDGDWIKRGEINYLGENKKIKIVESKNKKSSIKCIEDAFIIELPEGSSQETIKSLMEKYWRQEARKLLTKLTDQYCEALGCNYKKITLRKQKTRWGSCSSKGNISYNIKLMGAPIEVIEYIVLHEVMHLLHFNHGKTFWKAIEEIMPQYKEYQIYLKAKGMSLGI